jgi:outer membrane lipoprotein-sorting protein
MFRTFLTITAAIVFLSISVQAQTVDEIIAKNVQARGGMEKMNSVQTIRMTGKLSQESFRAGFMLEKKRPDKIREETMIQGLTAVQAYDGKTGWQVNPFGGRRDAELMSQDDLKSLQVEADIGGPLVDYKEKGHKAELVGHDSVEGTDCYKIKLSLKNGDVRYYFLDTDSFLELKVETQSNVRGTIQYSETYFGDYEQVNGLYYSFAFESGAKGDSTRVKYAVDKIEINVPIDDSVFAMPAVKSEAKQPGGAQ